MKRGFIKLIVTALVFSLLMPIQAIADDGGGEVLFDIQDEVWDSKVEANKERLSQEDVGVDHRIGVILGPADYDIDKEVFTIKAGTQGQLGCGVSRWHASFEVAAESLQSIVGQIEGTLQGALMEMPLLVTCYLSPTVCSYIKHFKHVMNQIVKFRSGQCQAITSLVDKKLQDWHAEQYQKCINSKKELGLSGPTDCGSMDIFEFVPQQDREPDGTYNITKTGLKHWFQAQGETDSEAVRKAEEYSAFLPTLIIGSGGWHSGEDNGGQNAESKDVRKKTYALYEEHHQKALECVQNIIDSAKASEDGTVTQDAILECDAAYMVMTPSQLAAIYNQLGEIYFENFMKRMAHHMAKQRTRNDLEKIIQATRGAMSKERLDSVIKQMMLAISNLEGLKKSYGSSQFDLKDAAQKELAEAVKKAEAEAKSKLTRDMVNFASGSMRGKSDGGFVTK
jgi:hypothetical protein